MSAAVSSTLRRWQARSPWAAAAGQQLVTLGALIVGFVAFQSWLRQVPHLAVDAYRAPFILSGLATATWRNTIGPIVIVILIALRGRRLVRPWAAFDHGAVLRPFFVLLVALSTWLIAGTDANRFMGQTHVFDRVALLALAALACWRPVFLAAFLWLGFALIWQFDAPLAFQFSWTEINLPLRLLILCAVSTTFESVSGLAFGTPLCVAVVSGVAASYWVSGFGKVQLGWLAHPGIFWLLPAGYAHGWLSFLDPELIRNWTELWRPIAWPMMALTLVLECGALICLWRRPLTIAMLVGWAALHLGILAACGIAFWHWVLIDLALAFGWWRRPELSTRAHTPLWFALSVVLIVASPFWLKPVALAWYDTPLTYTYRLEASDGATTWDVSHRAFSGYQDILAFSNLPYLDPARRLNDQIWGSTFDLETAEALSRARTLADVALIEAERGVVEFDASHAAAFDDLVGCSLAGTTAQPPALSAQAPGHLWVTARGEAVDTVSPVREVNVHRMTWLYTAEQGPRVIRDDLVRTIHIDALVAEGGCHHAGN